jgi:type VI protein secretion system component Hcp
MPAKSAAKKSAKKSSAKMHKGKALGSVKPLKDVPTEALSLNFSKIKFDYGQQ